MYTLYFLYDNKAQATFGPLLTCRNDAEASRYFRDMLGNKQTLPGQHPEDFDLYTAGDYDDKTGLITNAGTALVIYGKTVIDLMTEGSTK